MAIFVGYTDLLPGHLLLSGNTKSDKGMYTYIHSCKQWDIISHPCLEFNGDSGKPALKLGVRTLKTSYIPSNSMDAIIYPCSYNWCQSQLLNVIYMVPWTKLSVQNNQIIHPYFIQILVHWCCTYTDICVYKEPLVAHKYSFGAPVGFPPQPSRCSLNVVRSPLPSRPKSLAWIVLLINIYVHVRTIDV